MMEKSTNRIEWIDVCKGFAIIAIYFGHWLTPSARVESFVYSFHLQLFFIVSGFFAINGQKRKPLEFIKNQIKRLIIPLLVWNMINIIYFDLSEHKKISVLIREFITVFSDFSNSVAAELWFLPALFMVTITYYFLYKIIKNKYIILVISYALFLISSCYSETLVGKIILAPFIKLFSLSGIPTYLLWYAIGAVVYQYISNAFHLISDGTNRQRNIVGILGCSGLFISWILYSFKIDYLYGCLNIVPGLNKIIRYDFVYQNYRILVTILISTSIMFLSYVFRKSKLLDDIGKNTLILMGMEFIIKNLITFQILPMFNIGLPTLESELQVMVYATLMILIVRLSFKPINKHLKCLAGK